MNVTSDQMPRLKQLWNAGLSALECGQELGLAGELHEIREAVLRAVEGDHAYPTKAARDRKSRDANAARSNLPSRLATPARNPDPMFAVDGVCDTSDDLLEIPLEQRKTLLQLTEKTCHWPCGDTRSPDFFFCGGESVSGLPYCTFHCRVAYQPASDRRRDKRVA